MDRSQRFVERSFGCQVRDFIESRIEDRAHRASRQPPFEFFEGAVSIRPAGWEARVGELGRGTLEVRGKKGLRAVFHGSEERKAISATETRCEGQLDAVVDRPEIPGGRSAGVDVPIPKLTHQLLDKVALEILSRRVFGRPKPHCRSSLG